MRRPFRHRGVGARAGSPTGWARRSSSRRAASNCARPAPSRSSSPTTTLGAQAGRGWSGRSLLCRPALRHRGAAQDGDATRQKLRAGGQCPLRRDLPVRRPTGPWTGPCRWERAESRSPRPVAQSPLSRQRREVRDFRLRRRCRTSRSSGRTTRCSYTQVPARQLARADRRQDRASRPSCSGCSWALEQPSG